MTNIGDIIQFTVKQTYQDVVIINVDYRRIEEIDSNIDSTALIAQSYGNGWVSEVLPGLSSNLKLVEVKMDNLTDGISFGEWGFNNSGGEGGGDTPAFTCYAITLRRSTKITRNGSKRIAGVVEPYVEGNVQSFPVLYRDPMERFFGGQYRFEDPGNPSSNYDWQPVIIGRTLNAQGVYELDLTKINDVVIANMSPNVSTQNSRKVR